MNLFYLILFSIILFSIVIECRSMFKYFESKIDLNEGYWSPTTSSIDWCERNYVVTRYIAEFWNSISSLLMCLLAAILFLQGWIFQIEKRFLLMAFSFGLVGFGSAYFHGTLTHLGQMFDELPMVYSMIIWWFILFRMNQFKLKYSLDLLILFGIFYALLWTFLHSLKSFILIFQIHFTLMVLGGIIKLISLYKERSYYPYSIKYLIIFYITLLFPAILFWILDQQFCEQMNSKNGINPQFHAWWHLMCAIDCHVGIVCVQGMRILQIKSKEYQLKNEIFKSEDHLNIICLFGLPFIDYSKSKQIYLIKNQ